MWRSGPLTPDAVTLPQFGGYYVNSGNVPRVLRWIPSVSLIKHAFEGLCDNEFRGLEFEPQSADGTGDVRFGEQASFSASCFRLTSPCACPASAVCQLSAPSAQRAPL